MACEIKYVSMTDKSILTLIKSQKSSFKNVKMLKSAIPCKLLITSLVDEISNICILNV